jgi:hypothetical protein
VHTNYINRAAPSGRIGRRPEDQGGEPDVFPLEDDESDLDGNTEDEDDEQDADGTDE